MDGTLLGGTTASLQIARQLGSVEELTELEARFAAGEIDTRGFAAAIHELWRALTPSAVRCSPTTVPDPAAGRPLGDLGRGARRPASDLGRVGY